MHAQCNSRPGAEGSRRGRYTNQEAPSDSPAPDQGFSGTVLRECKNKIPVPVFFIFFVVALFASLASPQTAKADTTFSLYKGFLIGTVSINNSKEYYVAGETLTATGSLVPSPSAPSFDINTYRPYDVYLKVTVAGTTKIIDNMSEMTSDDSLSGSVTFTIPREGGTKTASFTASMLDSKDNAYSCDTDINYNVVYKPNITLVPSKTNVTSSSDAFTLTWSSSTDGATDQECNLVGGLIALKLEPSAGNLASGSISTTTDRTTTYTLTCASGYGNQYYSDIVSVSKTVNFPAPTVDVQVNNVQGPINVSTGGSAYVTWTTTGNPSSCSCQCQNPDSGSAINCGSSSYGSDCCPAGTTCGNANGLQPVVGSPRSSYPNPIQNIVVSTKFKVSCN